MAPGRRIGALFLRCLCRAPASQTNAKREAHPCAFAWVELLAMRTVKTFWKKKRLHPKMEPYESGANGRGRRKRRLPLDHAEGGGSATDPRRRSAGPREEDAVRRLIDKAVYEAPGPFPQCICQYASHALCAGKVSQLDPSGRRQASRQALAEAGEIRPRSRGERGRSLQQDCALCKERGRRRERVPAHVGHLRPRP